MRPEGLEPPRVAPQDPKSCASTSSATVARLLRFNLRGRALARHRRLRCNCALESPRGPGPPVLGALGAFRRVAFPPLRAAFSPCPAGARGSRFPPHDDSGGQLGAPEGRRTVPTAPRGVVRGEGGRERRGASPREREVGARAVGRVEVTEALPSRWTVV